MLILKTIGPIVCNFNIILNCTIGKNKILLLLGSKPDPSQLRRNVYQLSTPPSKNASNTTDSPADKVSINFSATQNIQIEFSILGSLHIGPVIILGYLTLDLRMALGSFLFSYPYGYRSRRCQGHSHEYFIIQDYIHVKGFETIIVVLSFS